MAREYIKVFNSYREAMEPLSDAEKGRLFTAMLDYSITGEVPKLRGNEKFIFPIFKIHIDLEAEAYRKTVEKNRINGAKGGRPRKNSGEVAVCGEKICEEGET